MVGGYDRNMCPKEALNLFCKMHREGVNLDGFSFGSMVNVRIN